MRLKIAWCNLLAKPVQSSLTILILAATIALLSFVILLSTGTHKGLVMATEPFDLILGAKGSPNQLVLNTVFLQDAPIGNVSHEIFETIQANPLVASAIPLGFGDSYQGYTIIGTKSSIFQHEPKVGRGQWLKIKTGRMFASPFEAVIGANVAQKSGLKLGDDFKSTHGLISGGQAHDHGYHVVGILEVVNGPYDQAILVPIESIWLSHEKHDHKVGEKESEHEEEGDVTAIMVKPKGYGEAMNLYQQFQQEPRVQLVFPSQISIQLFAILGQGEHVLRTLAYGVIIIGLMIMTLSVYWSALSRVRDRAILRALGASTRDIFTIVLGESTILTISGVVTGMLIGHGLYSILVKMMINKTAIVLTTGLTLEEVYIMIGGILFGIFVGVIPAALTYRKDVTQYL